MKKYHITVFEHQTLKLNQNINGIIFDENILNSLQKFHGEKGVPYYSLIHNGIKFCEYVGVIKINNVTIEVLPKVDKNSDEILWRDILIDMLRFSGIFKIHSPSSSNLKIKSSHILDLYFELFLDEVEYLLHRGLTKFYKKVESNSYSLKGRLNFSKNISKNLVHQERFYVEYNKYDINHKLHQILYKAILLLKNINTNHILQSRIQYLILNFPEQKDIKVFESTFQSIEYNRKTEEYRKAIEISKLLLLNYHPDLSKGKNNVLALMFDMNFLWEKFVYKVLKNGLGNNFLVTEQVKKNFWLSEQGKKISIRSDILITNKQDNNSFVLDTKWKNIMDSKISVEDLRQLYVYYDFYEAQKVALFYPFDIKSKGNYFDITNNSSKSNKECSLLGVTLTKEFNNLKENIIKVVRSVII